MGIGYVFVDIDLAQADVHAALAGTIQTLAVWFPIAQRSTGVVPCWLSFSRSKELATYSVLVSPVGLGMPCRSVVSSPGHHHSRNLQELY